MTLSLSPPFGEASGYPQSEWVEGEFRAVRKLIVVWDEIRDALDQLDTWPNQQYPYPEGTTDALARSAKIYPMPRAEQVNAVGSEFAEYRLGYIEVTYSTSGPQWYNGQLVDEELQPSATVHHIEHNILRWGDGKPLADDSAGIMRLEYGFDYIIHYPRVTVLPGWLMAMTGCVNSNTVVAPTLGLTFLPETLLYKGTTLKQKVGISGVRHQEIWVRFGIKSNDFMPVTWNMAWRTSTAQPENVFLIAGGAQYKSYPAVPFNMWS